MFRLNDQPRPFVWWLLSPFSVRYSAQREARHLPDWKRLVVRRGVYVPELKLLYVINQKAASSSLTDLLVALGGGTAGSGSGTTILFPTRRWQALATAAEDPEVYKFTVARHPVDRAVSTFFNLFVDMANGYSWRHVPYVGRTGLKFRDPSPENFDRYLDYVEELQNENELFCDGHMRIQTNNVAARQVRYDRIGHVERLREDVREIMAAAGGGRYRDDMLRWANKSSAGDSRFQPSPAQIARIETLYAEDYERMGYARQS